MKTLYDLYWCGQIRLTARKFPLKPSAEGFTRPYEAGGIPHPSRVSDGQANIFCALHKKVLYFSDFFPRMQLCAAAFLSRALQQDFSFIGNPGD